MFTFKVLKLFREKFGSWVTAAPPRRKPRRTILRLEVLEERWCPAAVNMYWDPTNGNNASTIIGGQAVNWDQGSLGSGTHPAAAPGMTAGETDNICFDGTTGQNGNQSCTWDYTPANALGGVIFQTGWNQTVSFNDKQGFKVSNAGLSGVSTGSTPTLAPNGSSGANAVAAITLTNGALFNIQGGTSLNLTGWGSTGNAIFFAGNGQAGEYIANGGTVTYTGHSSNGIDYLKIPILNSWTGAFNVNGGASAGYNSTLQVSGTDSNTNNASFYQNNLYAQTNISGKGTLWCYNNYTMTNGVLQTTDSNTDYLEVGTSSADGTVTLTGGSVNIYPSGTTSYGTLRIVGSLLANNPILNAGSVTFNFNIDLSNSANRSQLIVGDGSTGGKVNFGYNGGTATIAVNPLNSGTASKWNVLSYSSVTNTGSVQISTAGYTLNWSNANYLEVDKQ